MSKEKRGKAAGVITIMRDITERKRTEEALRESEEKYREVVERASDGIAIIQNMICKYANPSLANLSGETVEQITGKSFIDYVDPDELPKVADRYDRRMKGEDVPPIYETVLRRKDGTKIYVELNACIITYQNKLADLVLVRDITKRKQAEEALQRAYEGLKESEERYRTLVENIKLGINLIDINHNIIMTNAAQSKQFNKPASEIVGKKCFREFEKRDAVCPHCPGVQAMATGRSAEAETVGVRDDGIRHNVRLQAFPVFGHDGTPMGFIDITEDITERKKKEEELRESEEKYRSLVEFTEDPVYLVDKNRRYLFINEKYLSRLGLPRNDVIGRNYGDFHSPEENKEFSEHIEQVFATGQFVQYEHRSRRDDRYFLRTLSPVKEPDDSIEAVTVISKDITERKQAEQALQKSYHKLQETLVTTVHALASTVEMRDPYTAGHQRRVTILACAIAEAMGLREEQFDGLRLAGLIHDIGKISLPVEILNKPGRINKMEFNIIKIHPRTGYNLLKEIDFPWPVAQIVLQHHERLDGSGYPQGLKSGEIMLEAKILAVADVVEAMVFQRPYRPALGMEVALEEITKNREILYDPEAVDVCTRLFREKGVRLD